MQKDIKAFWIGDPVSLPKFFSKQDLENISVVSKEQVVLNGGSSYYNKNGLDILVFRPNQNTGMYFVKHKGTIVDSIPNDSEVFVVVPMSLLENLDMSYLQAGFWWTGDNQALNIESVKQGIYVSETLEVKEKEPE